MTINKYSPSHLTRFIESPFASWMDRYSFENPSVVTAKDPDDPLSVLLQKKGYLHEDAQIESFKKQGLSFEIRKLERAIYQLHLDQNN